MWFFKAYHKANEERKMLTNEITDVRSMKIALFFLILIKI